MNTAAQAREAHFQRCAPPRLGEDAHVAAVQTDEVADDVEAEAGARDAAGCASGRLVEGRAELDH